MAYFKSGGDDWREVLERSYPRDNPIKLFTAVIFGFS
jgi:hypothetical protein